MLRSVPTAFCLLASPAVLQVLGRVILLRADDFLCFACNHYKYDYITRLPYFQTINYYIYSPRDIDIM